jgi:hypothetical protein
MIPSSLDFLAAALAFACLMMSMGNASAAVRPADDVRALAGKPADIVPSAYKYRRDRAADQNDPETWILLMQYAGQRIDRPADVNAPEIKRVLCAFLWEEVRPIRRVELVWTDGERPSPSDISLIYSDTSVEGIHTWWNGCTPMKDAGVPELAADGKTYSYSIPSDAFGLIVCTRGPGRTQDFPVPSVRAYGPDVWKQMDIEIEWGYEASTKALRYDGRIMPYDGVIGNLQPLADDAGTTVEGPLSWKSTRTGNARRGVRMSVLYMGSSPNLKAWPMDSTVADVSRTIVTVQTKHGSFSFMASDLENGPILAPEYSFFVRCTTSGKCSQAAGATDFVRDLKARNLKTTRERVRAVPDQTWEGAVRAMWPEAELPPIPKPEFLPRMLVDLPSEELTAQWSLGAWHLLRRAIQNDKGQWRFNDYPFAILASETYQILHVLDLMGMHREAADGLDQWLELPVDLPKPVGWFSDGNGALSHAKNYVSGAGSGAFKEDVGGGMDAVHAMGPGAIGYALVEHYRLTDDKKWLENAAPRLKANARWILRQRRLLAENIPGGERLWCKGLLPPHQVTPDSGGMLMQFYESEAYYWLAVKGLAEVLSLVNEKESAKLAAQAELYRKDLLAAVERSIMLTPVVRVRDGTYRSFIPFSCYVRGFASAGWNWRRPGSPNHVNGLYWDTVQSAAPLISPAALLPASDKRVQGFLDVLEDRLLLENERLGVRTPGYSPERDWFAHAGWQYQCGLERQANMHLHGDDAPGFLRTMLNQYAVDIRPGEYTFREHTVTGPPDKSFEESAFLERLRNMLVMEEDGNLWLARAVPRSWFAQGKRVAVKNAPTYFGKLDYEIVSDVDSRQMTATIHAPDRATPETVILRLRHPKKAPIRSAKVNGLQIKSFDKDREIIRLSNCKGTVVVEVNY